MRVYEEEFEIPAQPRHENLLPYLDAAVKTRFSTHQVPVRFVITRSDKRSYRCEAGVLADIPETDIGRFDCSLFRIRRRKRQNTSSFVSVFLVPTGIGCEIGGHAGDATPALRLIASVSDLTVTHPNVVNASDVNEIPDNALYAEGSIITRFMMGAIGLQQVRANRVLAIIDNHEDEAYSALSIDTVNAARATYGLDCERIFLMDPPIKVAAHYSASGRAVGQVEGLDRMIEILDEHRGEYDAVAVATVIEVPFNLHTDYYSSRGAMINPWGGVEAMLTHSLSSLFDIPTAHAPMEPSEEVAALDLGIVDSRMAAEAISATYFQCILKGLQRSPRIIRDIGDAGENGILTAEDIDCLVIPDGVVGIPTLAALEQRIPVIAVRENKNIMENDLAALPWRRNQLHIVENYWEAAGVVAALRAGIAPASVRRPIAEAAWERVSAT